MQEDRVSVFPLMSSSELKLVGDVNTQASALNEFVTRRAEVQLGQLECHVQNPEDCKHFIVVQVGPCFSVVVICLCTELLLCAGFLDV